MKDFIIKAESVRMVGIICSIIIMLGVVGGSVGGYQFGLNVARAEYYTIVEDLGRSKKKPTNLVIFEMPDMAKEIVIRWMQRGYMSGGPYWGATMYMELKGYKFSFSSAYEKTPALAVKSMVKKYEKFMQELYEASKKGEKK